MKSSSTHSAAHPVYLHQGPLLPAISPLPTPFELGLPILTTVNPQQHQHTPPSSPIITDPLTCLLPPAGPPPLSGIMTTQPTLVFRDAKEPIPEWLGPPSGVQHSLLRGSPLETSTPEFAVSKPDLLRLPKDDPSEEDPCDDTATVGDKRPAPLEMSLCSRKRPHGMSDAPTFTPTAGTVAPLVAVGGPTDPTTTTLAHSSSSSSSSSTDDSVATSGVVPINMPTAVSGCGMATTNTTQTVKSSRRVTTSIPPTLNTVILSPPNNLPQLRGPPGATYFLMKSEPQCYSIDMLQKEPAMMTCWDGVRNYEARNTLKEMKIGDMAFFYHCNCKDPGIVGVMEIAKESYVDHTAWQPGPGFDMKSPAKDPKWVMVDVKMVFKFRKPVTLGEIKNTTELKNMQLLTRPRLEISHVTEEEWDVVIGMEKEKLIDPAEVPPRY